MLGWLPLLGAVGLTRDGAEMDAQSLAASLLAQQHAAEAHQRHMHHNSHAAHQKRGLPTMKELMEARQEAERHAGTVLVEPSRPGHTSGGAPHQAQPAARSRYTSCLLSAGEKCTRTTPVASALKGSSSLYINFGNVIKTNFTICSATKYNGDTQHRILVTAALA